MVAFNKKYWCPENKAPFAMLHGHIEWLLNHHNRIWRHIQHLQGENKIMKKVEMFHNLSERQ